MTKLFIHITENGQQLLLSICYSCHLLHGIANYIGSVECSVEPLTPFDPYDSACCEFSFCRDAYWNAMSNGSVNNLRGYGRSILKDVLLRVAKAIMEHEERVN